MSFRRPTSSDSVSHPPRFRLFTPRAENAPRSKLRRVFNILFLTAGAASLPLVDAAIPWLRGDYEQGATDILDPQKFTRFILISKEPVSSTSSIFTLRPDYTHLGIKDEEARGASRLKWPEGVIWSVQIKQPQLQIGRFYTPLPPLLSSNWSPEEPKTRKNKEQPNGARTQEDEIRLLIRKEHQGEVSTYLHQLPIGAAIELRGPHIEHTIDEDVQRILFLAGGTGIAPALQAAHVLLHQRNGRHHEEYPNGKNSPENQQLDAGLDQDKMIKEVFIIWANRRREDCLGGVNTSSDPSDAEPQNGSPRIGLLGRFLPLGAFFWRGSSSRSSNDGSTIPNKSLALSPLPEEPQTRAEAGQDLKEEQTQTIETRKESGKGEIVQHLESLKAEYPNHFQIQYCVDEEGSFITKELLKRYLPIETNTTNRMPTTTHLTKKQTNEPIDNHPGDFPPPDQKRRRRKNLILISGPEGFVTYLAGPRPSPLPPPPDQKHEETPIGGLLSHFFPPLLSPAPTSTVTDPTTKSTSMPPRSISPRDVDVKGMKEEEVEVDVGEETWEVIRL